MSWNGLNPEFARRLNAFILAAGAAGFQISLGSGYRSLAQQQKLYDAYRRGEPGQARAAKPGKSNHNHGLAGDLEFGNGARAWAHKNAGQFGLFFPMGDEPWHIEGIGLTGGSNNAAAYPSAITSMPGPQADPFTVAMQEIERAILGNPTADNPVIAAPAFDLVDEMGQSLTSAADPTAAGAFPGLAPGDPAAAAGALPAGASAMLGSPDAGMMASPTGGLGEEGAGASIPTSADPGLPGYEPPAPTALPGGSGGGVTSSALMAAVGPNGALPPGAIAAAAAAAGFQGEALVTAVAVGLAESSGRPTVGSFVPGAPSSGDSNLTQQGETSAGIWQINYRPSRDQGNPIRDPYANADPLTNARNAYQIYMGAGGTFTDWTTFNQGQYQGYMEEARQAVAQMGQYAGMLGGGSVVQPAGPKNTPGANTPSARMGESFRTPFRRDQERQRAVNNDRQPKKRQKNRGRGRSSTKDI